MGGKLSKWDRNEKQDKISHSAPLFPLRSISSFARLTVEPLHSITPALVHTFSSFSEAALKKNWRLEVDCSLDIWFSRWVP